MKITDALKKYREKKSRVESIMNQIKAYRDTLKTGELHLLGYYTKQTSDAGMPKARSNNSPVEREAFQTFRENDLTRELIQEWIDEETSKLWMIHLEVTQIEIALKALTREEKCIIEWKYMDGLNWYSIELSYCETFKKALTSDALQKKNGQAINKITDILKPFYDKFRNIA